MILGGAGIAATGFAIYRIGSAAVPFVIAAARSPQADKLLKAGAKVVGRVSNKAKDAATRVVDKLNKTVINTSASAGSGTTSAAVAENTEFAAALGDPELRELATDPDVHAGLAFMAKNLVTGRKIMTGEDRPAPDIKDLYPRRALGGDVADTNLQSMDDVNLLINVLNNSGSSPDQINAYMQEHIVNKTGD
tara:strand:+ start:112 stop:687 length:576 start_codon:yes stop_codon:yes gene_type:complete